VGLTQENQGLKQKLDAIFEEKEQMEMLGQMHQDELARLGTANVEELPLNKQS